MKESVESVEFRKAKGGMVSETRYKSKRSGQGGGGDYDYRHETAIHPNAEHAGKHLAKMFGGSDEPKEGDKPEKAAT
jgi:hypothetical protein